MDKEHKSTMKSISRLITQSSHQFFSAFLDDSKDNRERSKEREKILKELQLAAAQKSLVVLQLKEGANAKFETASGWIVSKSITDSLMLRSQEDTQQIRMIAVDHIKRISTLASSDKRLIK